MEFIKEVVTVIFSIFNAMSPYLLLGFLFAGILHVLVPQQWFSKYLSKNQWTSVLYATLFGIPLPLCSCGVIPTAMAMYKEGASKGATIAFLIATPQTGVDSIIATYSLLGLPFAVIRPIVACFTAVFAGLTANAFSSHERALATIAQTDHTERAEVSLTRKLKMIFQYGYVEMMEDIGKMLLLGLIIAGLITYFVPDNFFTLFGNNTILTMFLVLAVSIPMYVCATGSIPIAIALMMKGMSPGTALVLLMAGPAANIASMLVIAKVLGRKTFLLYLTTLIMGAIASGLFIDNFLPARWFDVSNFAMAVHHHGSFYYFQVLCSIILLMLFINTRFLKKKKNVPGTQHSAIKFKIDGMTCNHCKSNVARVISNLNSVKQVTVDLSTGFAYVEGNPTDEEIKSSVEAIGFKFKGRF